MVGEVARLKIGGEKLWGERDVVRLAASLLKCSC